MARRLLLALPTHNLHVFALEAVGHPSRDAMAGARHAGHAARWIWRGATRERSATTASAWHLSISPSVKPAR